MRTRGIKRVLIILLTLISVLAALPVEAKPIAVNWYGQVKENPVKLNLPGDDRVDTFFTLQGQVGPGYEALLVRTVLGAEEVYYYFPVKQQTVSGTVYLRFGSGTYHVEINLVKPDDDPAAIYFDRLASAEIENTAAPDLRYLLPSWGIESDNQLITAKAKEITKDAMTDYERVKAVHDWVSKYVVYDTEKYLKGEFYSNDGALNVLATGKGLCRDYANLTTALCRALGIEARTVIGQAGSGNTWYGHAWNEVRVGDRWISLDSTWDAGYLQGNRFFRAFSRKYFDTAAELFGKTHRKTLELY